MTKSALITGASEGIGRELSSLLAKDGYNLILVARNKARLEQLATELGNQFKVDSRVIVKDLSQDNAAQEIFDELNAAALPVDVLINDAGLGLYGPFAKSDLATDLHMIHVNLVTLTKLTWLFLPGMLERKSGKIMTVGSIASFAPAPLFSLYNASKAYVLYFSEALGEELKGTGVTVTCLCPGSTRTQWHNRAKSENIRLNKFTRRMDARAVAEIGYEALMSSKRLVIPGPDNKLFVIFSKFAPRGLGLKLTHFLTQESRK